ncbi:tyrosine-type recombinase/integrase [Salmonella enterica subsp. houtenae serovar 6,7:z4,z24:-]|uniref:tyrosine-type recombinase/integrase n=1 Tax=Citrobacter TaxID=544 RepID=UPI0015EE596F|nr:MULTISPECIES: tyrosine-type recombinase/integrase [Citrobacter]EFD1699722.1 site-specific integrase [Escherichia coli]EKX5708414.1 tyrosine-type recombinase/integrase [Citrobacter freundii]EKQ4495337.1 tyrosine-type recombinase/integrase [Escherichia coli]EKY0071391.1 tyrosine-type recombinase/integrase [Citrobacter freundii]EKY0342626.1 tyrosine-type recombinase/integrase [Citrobacter freundii]
MRLVFATQDLTLANRSFEGFPLLIGADGWPVQPAQSFLWHILIESGESLSTLTWEAYGRRLYDYFAFLEANALAWNDETPAHGLSVLSRYRDWSIGELALNPRTVNNRLALIVRFYRWAKLNNLIKVLPFREKKTHIVPHSGLLSHVTRPGKERSKISIMLRERKRLMKFLTKEQVKVCLALDADPSHQILFHLMVRTGLRSCEARSFPLKYVFNPRLKNGLRRGQMISVALEPSDMQIKYDRPRIIDVPWSLMEDMWSYSLHQRQMRNSRGDGSVTALLLTNEGKQYSKDAVVDIMKSYERKCGFYVRAHMLRHTYGTYTLLALRKTKEFEGEPLMYVRDRLGHSDVQTTMIYLHLINQLEAQSVLAYEDEIDMMFMTTSLNHD